MGLEVTFHLLGAPANLLAHTAHEVLLMDFFMVTQTARRHEHFAADLTIVKDFTAIEFS